MSVQRSVESRVVHSNVTCRNILQLCASTCYTSLPLGDDVPMDVVSASSVTAASEEHIVFISETITQLNVWVPGTSCQITGGITS